MTSAISSFPTKVPLSGADCFFLAMEGHYKKHGNAGNVCHLWLSLDAKITKQQFETAVLSFPIISWIRGIVLKRNSMFGIPHWEFNPSKLSPLEIKEYTHTDEILPKELVQNGLFLDSACLCKFTLLQRSNGKTDIVFSWHHILMDARGAETLLRAIGGDIPLDKVKFFPEKEKFINPFRAFYILHFSKEFIKKSSKKPLVQLVSKEIKGSIQSDYLVLELTAEQTSLLDKRALEHGAKVSKGSFYLAATTKAINQLLLTKNNSTGNFWIPIPQNRRPRGSFGPVVSNLQAFMFYRIPREKAMNLKVCTEYLTAQMFDLIRNKRPDDYAVMSGLLRRLPSRFYYWLIKGPSGGSMASFLYTDPGVNEFKTFLGLSVKDVTNYPPGTFPPGLMTVYERFNGKQKIIINHALPVMSIEELEQLKYYLLKELLGENA